MGHPNVVFDGLCRKFTQLSWRTPCVVFAALHEGPRSCSFLLERLGIRDDIKNVCILIFFPAARGDTFASIAVPVTRTIASNRRGVRSIASTAEDDADDNDRHPD